MTLNELVEAFDSALTLTWQPVKGGGEAAGFSVDDVNYILQLLPLTIDQLKVYEVSFHLYDESGDKAFASTGNTKSPTSVYGVVINGLIQKLEDWDGDAIVFETQRRHSASDEQHAAKVKLYELAAKRISKKLGWETYRGKNEFLLTKEYHGDSIKSFKHWQEEVREAVGLPTQFPSLERNSGSKK